MGSKPKVPSPTPFVRGSVAQFNADGRIGSVLSGAAGDLSKLLAPRGSRSLLSQTAGASDSVLGSRSTLGGM